MKTTNCLTSACRYCRFYNSEGRRGGSCQQLGVPVEGNWKACHLALPPFTSAWESLEEIVLLEHSYQLVANSEAVPQATEPKVRSITAKYSQKTFSNPLAKTHYLTQEALSA